MFLNTDILLLVLIMLIVSRSIYMWKIIFIFHVINCRFHFFFRSSASSFSSQYLLFLKLLKSCVLLLPTPFTSAICLSMASHRRQYLVWICPIQMHILLWVLLSSLRSRTSSLDTCSDYIISYSLLDGTVQ